MATYKTPGVYVEEISTMPPSVAEVETAIPAFIGFTEKGILNVPKKITSLKEFQDFFGMAQPETGIAVTTTQVDDNGKKVEMVADVSLANPSSCVLYYAMQLYFENGGGPCYIISTGLYAEAGADVTPYTKAIDISSREDEPTLLVLPDAPFLLSPGDYYSVMNHAIDECIKLGDRFAIVDVIADEGAGATASIDAFRAKVKSSKYAAAYFPYLNTEFDYYFKEDNDDAFTITVSPDAARTAALEQARNAATAARKKADAAKSDADAKDTAMKALADSDQAKAKATTDAKTAADRFTKTDADAKKLEDALKEQEKTLSQKKYSELNNLSKNQVKQKVGELTIKLTPCAAMAGVYASVDNARGVWKAPANVSLDSVSSTNFTITDYDQQAMNIDVDAGKSINALRFFPGKGILVWGARTLDGNDNEWRYINVRRFFNMVEESIKKSTYWAVFEPNDKNTWVKVRAMIENYLILKWKDGALAGAKPDDAFFVRVGLGQTMSPQDVLEGRMIIEIGLAAVRPAEFIILKFSHKMQTT